MHPQHVVRHVPALSWNRHAMAAALLATIAIGGWEITCRNAGYAPGLDDTVDLWVEARRSVCASSTVIVGASRGLFGLDLDVLERDLGARPVQLAMVGSNPIPVLEDLAADASFRGDVIVDLVPGLLLVPEDSPPYQNAARAVKRHREQSWAQFLGHELSLPLERSLAFVQQEDLTLAAMLAKLPVPDREGTQVPPALPPFFYTTDADRRARMKDVDSPAAEALIERVKLGWLPLFTPPPPPKWIPAEAFGAGVGAMLEARFEGVRKAVAALTARGCRVVFVRMPSTGELWALEARTTPRQAVWERVLRETGAPDVHFEDHVELADFDCPEWSHLTAADSVIFTERLVPHLRRVLPPRETVASCEGGRSAQCSCSERTTR